MYNLEVISVEPEVRRYATPLLFVHGAYVAAWCWEENFLPYFAKQGFSAHAISLRGHGNSEGGLSLHSHTIRDYVEDLAWAVDQLDAPPVLMGHSMGGMVVQKYLEENKVPGAVLLNTIPHSGVGMAAFEIAMRAPFSYVQMYLAQNWGTQFSTSSFSRDMLFSKDTSESSLQRYQNLFQAESQAAIMDMSGMDLPLPHKVRDVPMLFLGSEGDQLFSCNMVQKTAQCYGEDAVFFPESGHMLMLDAQWKQAADHIVDWMEANALSAAIDTDVKVAKTA